MNYKSFAALMGESAMRSNDTGDSFGYCLYHTFATNFPDLFSELNQEKRFNWLNPLYDDNIGRFINWLIDRVHE